MKSPVPHGIAVAALLVIGGNAWAQQAAGTRPPPDDPNAEKPPMQAQELASLVPKDLSQPRAADINRDSANSYYRYDQAGVNCSLYPAHCRGEDY